MTANRPSQTLLGKALLSLLVLALLGGALRLFVFSTAAFTADASATASLKTGSFSHTNSRAGLLVLDATRLSPGQSKSATLTITGGGDGTGAYTITRENLQDTPASPTSPFLSPVLMLTITDLFTSTAVYDGTVGNFTASSPTILVLPGETHTIEFTMAYPLLSADPALRGASLSFSARVTGVSQ